MNALFLDSINDISEDSWNQLWQSDYPFIQHGFLGALENSGCTTGEQGWQPRHLIIEDNNKSIAALPLYEKNHSYGEYVFDWAWADAYHRAGINYYPKLINSIPFTPATGPRITFSQDLSDQQRHACVQLIRKSLETLTLKLGGSGIHFLFPDTHSSQYLDNLGLAERQGCQFHWFNLGFKSFDDFLSRFNSRKRKSLRKERLKVSQSGIQTQCRDATGLSPTDWDNFYQLYQRTYLKRSGHNGYLNAQFFHTVAQAIPDNVLLISAHKPLANGELDSDMIAGALYFKDEKNLYGRYWGCKEDIDGLHFECCYYLGIEYAIKNGLARFDPGAQGEHKIQRGFTPVKTRSFHLLEHPEFFEAVKQFVEEEKQHNHQYCQDGRNYLPFKDGNNLVSDDILL